MFPYICVLFCFLIVRVVSFVNYPHGMVCIPLFRLRKHFLLLPLVDRHMCFVVGVFMSGCHCCLTSCIHVCGGQVSPLHLGKQKRQLFSLSLSFSIREKINASLQCAVDWCAIKKIFSSFFCCFLLFVATSICGGVFFSLSGWIFFGSVFLSLQKIVSPLCLRFVSIIEFDLRDFFFSKHRTIFAVYLFFSRCVMYWEDFCCFFLLFLVHWFLLVLFSGIYFPLTQGSKSDVSQKKVDAIFWENSFCISLKLCFNKG